jgi:serine/threonine protein kinase
MENKSQRDNCLKEVQLHQSLDHPNIVKYLNWFIDNKLNELFIAVEWAEKGDLKQVMKRNIEEDISFPEKRIWEYISQIAGALAHMHEKRIMHRDLKPANIFIDNNGDLKVGDLGLSRQLSSQTLEAFSRVGTPLYMSPEVLQGKGYDWKSDVWSLGCIAYELCMLRSPFRQDDKENLSLYDLFQRITKGQFPPLNEKYSSELRGVINGMLKLDPDQRFDINQVVQLCETFKQTLGNKPAIDTYLIMDDIIEKLSLLDYENLFCKGYRHGRVSRIYFAHKPEGGETET